MKNWFLLSLGFLMFSTVGCASEISTSESTVAQSSEKVVVREIARKRRRHRNRKHRHHRRRHRHHYRW